MVNLYSNVILIKDTAEYKAGALGYVIEKHEDGQVVVPIVDADYFDVGLIVAPEEYFLDANQVRISPTQSLDEHAQKIVEEASTAMGISRAEFINQAVKFAATANAVYYENPRTTLGMFGPIKSPSLTQREFYGWCPHWVPPTCSKIYCGTRREDTITRSETK